MKLSEAKRILSDSKTIQFQLPDGQLVPTHFHITEIGLVNKHFIDCGGTLREEQKVNFQLYSANDYDHRLHPEKLIHIIELSEKALEIPDLEIEVEYQGDTIGKYRLEHDGYQFLLLGTKTDCLAKDQCGIPSSKPKIRLSELQKSKDICCEPASGCCS